MKFSSQSLIIYRILLQTHRIRSQSSHAPYPKWHPRFRTKLLWFVRLLCNLFADVISTGWNWLVSVRMYFSEVASGNFKNLSRDGLKLIPINCALFYDIARGVLRNILFWTFLWYKSDSVTHNWLEMSRGSIIDTSWFCPLECLCSYGWWMNCKISRKFGGITREMPRDFDNCKRNNESFFRCKSQCSCSPPVD